MKTLIFVLIVIFSILSLGRGRNRSNNNFFFMLCVVTIVTTAWILAPLSWGYQVVAIYIALVCIPVINWIKKRGSYSTLSLFTRIPIYGSQRAKAAKKLTLVKDILLFFIYCGIVVSCYQIMSGHPLFWEGIIVAPAGLIAIAVAIIQIKKWLDSL